MNTDKESVIKLIKEAIIKEEEAIPIYADHISTALHWSGFPESERQEILEKLELLQKESKFHAEALRRVIDILEKE